MCGIAGIVGGTDHRDGEALTAMLAALAHRGPEDAAARTLGAARFGYCKLGFVAVDHSAQPALSRDGRVLAVFNGEIYNHAELAHRFGTPPGLDEAALLAELFARRGADVLADLEGMFAVAFHDAATGETVLARDRFGEKPLAYLVAGRTLVFASEVRALERHPACPTDVDPAALARYLTFNAVPAPATLLAGVRKVPPGATVTVRGGAARVAAWWEPRLGGHGHSDGAGLAGELRRSVRRRLAAEAPVGLLLSGGVDSSLIAAIAVQEAGRPLRSFSAGFPDEPTFDESAAAEEVAGHLGTFHTTVEMTGGRLAEAAGWALAAVDEPIADQSLLPTALLARVLRRDVKAVLTGDGADELAMGYRLFPVLRAVGWAERVAPRRWLQAALAGLGRARPGETNLHPAHVAGLLARSLAAPPEHMFFVGGAAFPPGEWAAVLEPELAHLAAGTPVFDHIDRLVASHPGATQLERLQLGMVAHFLRDVILAKVDRATMLSAVEARAPFLAHPVAERLLALPEDDKLRGMQTKHMVRRLAAAHLPAPVARRRKQGFRLPTARLLRGELRPLAEALLAPDAVRRHGVLAPAPVARLLADHQAGGRDHHRRLWALLCLQAWLEARAAARTRVGAREPGR